MTKQLKSCPFCGGAARVFESSSCMARWSITAKHDPECPLKSLAHRDRYISRDRAVTSWEARTPHCNPTTDYKITSWVTLARPFAKRRSIYKRKAEMCMSDDGLTDYFQYAFGVDAVSYSWYDFITHITKGN